MLTSARAHALGRQRLGGSPALDQPGRSTTVPVKNLTLTERDRERTRECAIVAVPDWIKTGADRHKRIGLRPISSDIAA